MIKSTKVKLTIDMKKLTTFLGLTTEVRDNAAPIQQSGDWLVCKSPYKWGDIVHDSTMTAGEVIGKVKDLGFKSAWIRGGRLGVNVKDVAKAA